jgi:putative sigma-54 modulation protein
MRVSITGHHLPITEAIRDYVEQKLSRAWRHFGQGLEAQVVLSVERHEQRAEVTVHFQGKDLHAEAKHADLYAAIDLLADKIDRQVVRYKEQHQSNVHHGKPLPAPLE